MNIIYVFIFYFLVGVVFYLFVNVWREYRRDLLRHRLFIIRDKLFIVTEKSISLSFDNKAYGLARTTLNGMIRYADELTLGQIIIDSIILGKNEIIDDSYIHEMETALGKLNDLNREIIEDAIDEMHQVVVSHVVATNPVLFILWLPVKLINLVATSLNFSIVRFLMNKSEKRIQTLDLMANTVGRHDLAARAFLLLD